MLIVLMATTPTDITHIGTLPMVIIHTHHTDITLRTDICLTATIHTAPTATTRIALTATTLLVDSMACRDMQDMWLMIAQGVGFEST